MRSRPALLPLLIVLLALATPALGGELDHAMRQYVRSADLRTTQVSLFAMDLDTGNVIGSLEPDQPMIPASNMKVVTTAAAMDVLGPEFLFRTELAIRQPSAAAPELVVKGDGDPAFGDAILLGQHGLNVEQLLASWVEVVRQTGHTRFARLVLDDRVFDEQFSHEDWPEPDLRKGYGAQVAGINFYTNVVDILPTPTVEGQAARVDVFPDAPHFEKTNRTKTGGKTDHFILDRRLGTNQLIFGGNVKNRRTVPFQVSIHDPAVFFGQVFAARLAQAGITVDAVVRPEPQEELDDTRPLHVVQTTLPLVLARTNQDSQNMFAEALVKRMGHQLTGQPGSWDNGAAAIRAVLRQRLGARSSAMVIADGSGMSRNNRVTARLLVELLRELHQDPTKGPIFLESLSAAGENGTLQQRLNDLGGRVYGKSGYIGGVSTLTGYLVIPAAEGGRPRTIGFSFLFNGFKPPLYARNMKRVQDGLLALIDKAYAPREEPANLGGCPSTRTGERQPRGSVSAARGRSAQSLRAPSRRAASMSRWWVPIASSSLVGVRWV